MPGVVEPEAKYVPPPDGREWLAAARKEDFATLRRLYDKAGAALVNYCGKGTSYGFVGNSALHWAAAKNNTALIKWLLSVGAQLDVGNGDNATPLHSAASNNSLAAAELLLERGADSSRRDGLDETPRDAATRRGFSALAKKFDALAGAGALRRVCAELLAAPEATWTIKDMKSALELSGHPAEAQGITEKEQLRERARAVVQAFAQPEGSAWYAPPSAAPPGEMGDGHAAGSAPRGSAAAAAGAGAPAAPAHAAQPCGGASKGAGRARRKKNRGAKPRPAADQSDSDDNGPPTPAGVHHPLAAGPAASPAADTSIAASAGAGAGAAPPVATAAGGAEGAEGAEDAAARALADAHAAACRLHAAALFNDDDLPAAHVPANDRVARAPGSEHDGGGRENALEILHAVPQPGDDGDDDDDDDDDESNDGTTASNGSGRARQVAAAANAKEQGNSAFSAGDYVSAVKYYTVALRLDSRSHVLFSNRSACHAALGDGGKALDDARQCVRLDSSWAKGHGRVGAALLLLGRPQAALEAYEAGLTLEPGSEGLRRGAGEARAALDRGAAGAAELAAGAPEGGARRAGEGACSAHARRSSSPPPPPLPQRLDHLPIDAQWIEHSKSGSVSGLRALLAQSPALLTVLSVNSLGHSALHWAAARNHYHAAEWLLDQGLAADVRNKMGATPLHSAVANGCAVIIELLARRGADMTARDGAGEDARGLALRRGYPRIAELLDKLGGTDRQPQRAGAQHPSGSARADAGETKPAVGGSRHTRESLHHLSYEQLIDLVLELQPTARSG
ncbi:hypothetical protein KFE25_008032 [Diacronema lutheri]|uniref:Uncharacterized protein n=1 Tax=Diacronema lutheri TaxID=2081491 RepID=A0A8J5XGF2_DIALT|nr:hypothetical protein KFE25_008032 [Diacronema lutheri]